MDWASASVGDGYELVCGCFWMRCFFALGIFINDLKILIDKENI